jgi:hypothetical protein
MRKSGSRAGEGRCDARRASAAFCVLALALAACASGQQPGPSREETVLKTVHARVEAIDRKTRVVTLVNAVGEKVVFRADDGVRNLDQVKVGDVVVGELQQTLLVELRAATEEEQRVPAQVAEVAARAEPGQRPAGVFVRQVRALFTIAEIDKAAGGGTLRDAEGRLQFVKARDPSVLDRVRVGDTVVVTYTEALRLQVVSGGS